MSSSFYETHRLTELFLGLLKGLFKVGTGVGRGELEDKAALRRGRGELQLCGQESHAEGQGLFVRQLPVHRRHQVLNHLVQGLGDAQEEETVEINLYNIWRYINIPEARGLRPFFWSAVPDVGS